MSALLAALALAAAAPSAVRVVPFDDRTAGIAHALAAEAPAIADRAARRLDLPLPPEILIVVAWDFPRGERERARLALPEPPAWADGIAEPDRGRIVLFAGRIAGGPHEDPTGLLAHEVAHLVFGAAIPRGAEVPRWYQEGLAMSVERDVSLPDALRLAMLSVWGDPPPLASLERDFPPASDAARTAYTVSLAIVSDAERGAWPGAARRMAEALSEGRPFERAFTVAYGRSVDVVEYAWRAQARRRYFVQPILWAAFGVNAALGVLAAAAVLVARARHKRRLAQMPTEDDAVWPPEE